MKFLKNNPFAYTCLIIILDLVAILFLSYQLYTLNSIFGVGPNVLVSTALICLLVYQATSKYFTYKYDSDLKLLDNQIMSQADKIKQYVIVKKEDDLLVDACNKAIEACKQDILDAKSSIESYRERIQNLTEQLNSQFFDFSVRMTILKITALLKAKIRAQIKSFSFSFDGQESNNINIFIKHVKELTEAEKSQIAKGFERELNNFLKENGLIDSNTNQPLENPLEFMKISLVFNYEMLSETDNVIPGAISLIEK